MDDFFAYEPETEELKVNTSVPADLAGTVDLIDSWEDSRGPATTVWFTGAGAARLDTEAVTLRFGPDTYSWELERNGVEREGEFAPGSPTDGANGVAWAAAHPALAALEAVAWAERHEEEEREIA